MEKEFNNKWSVLIVDPAVSGFKHFTLSIEDYYLFKDLDNSATTYRCNLCQNGAWAMGKKKKT